MKILAFGTFDGIHTGHEYFLSKAKKNGDFLVVAVARDDHVSTLKHKQPEHSEQDRLRAVQELSVVDGVQLCDETLGSYDIIKSVQPDCVAIGHDQLALKESLQEWLLKEGIDLKLVEIKKYE